MAYLALDEIRPGLQVDRYVLLEPIGSGGQGAIWSAVDEEHGRVVAIKLAPAGKEDRATFVELLHEAETVRRLSHPNILPIYEFGKAGSLIFLAMRYAPGGSLLDRLRRGTLDIHNRFFIAAQISTALAFVHDQRVIHRDLKPSNILMNRQSHIYLSDFGLARVISDETKQLHTGHGTPAYSPPEQILGRAVTHRSDIYSFGIVLYELLSGHLPWNGAKNLATSQMDEGEPLPFPVTAPVDFSPELLGTLRRLTAVEQEDRPNSVEEAFDDVCAALAGDKLPSEVMSRLRASARAASDPATSEADDTADLLRERLGEYRRTGQSGLSLTEFSLIDALRWHGGPEGVTPTEEQSRMIWESALRYGRSAGRWWAELESPEARIAACERVIGHADPDMLERVILLLSDEPGEVLRQYPLNKNSLRRLLEAGMSAVDVTLQSRTIDLLRRIPPETGQWQLVVFDEALDRRLGEYALGDTFGAEETARYIGSLRSEVALRVVLNGYRSDDMAISARAQAALRSIAQGADGLPDFVPWPLRLRLGAGQAWAQLTANPANLARVLGVSLAAGFAGLLLHFYLVIDASPFLDAERLTVALERALISGPFLGVTILLVRLLAGRLSTPSRRGGLAASLIAGTAGCCATFLAIDYLFLKSMPGLVPITAGGLLISLGYAAAERLGRRPRAVRVLAGAAGMWLGVAGTWLGYLAARTTPLFYFSPEWGLWQVLLEAGAVSLLTSFLAHSVDLTQQMSYNRN